MIRLLFSTEEIKALYDCFKNAPDSKVRQRAGAVYFKSQKLAHQEICRLLRISSSSLTKYLKLYREGGIEALKQFNYKGQVSALWSHKDLIIAAFSANPPADISEARQRIFQLTSILLSPSAIRNFLKKIGLKYLKTGTIPGGEKGNTNEKKKERKQWLDHELEPRLEEAKQGDRIVLFMDAAHFVFRAYTGFLWCFTRVFLASPSGRKRFNVLGAVNAIDKQVFTISNTAYINAKSVCQLLKNIYLAYHYLNIPLTIVLDNARYQKCKLVRRYARMLGIELLYMPAYSPQLNIIERLWKLVKRTCLYAKYYETFELFCNAIITTIEHPKEKQKSKIRSLLNLKFQSFDEVEMRAA